MGIFQRVCRQWRTIGGSALSLDYTILPFIFDIYEVDQSERLQFFEDIKVMENAALEVINKG